MFYLFFASREDENTSSILTEDFMKYASLVDDINGINNYADASLALCKPAKNGVLNIGYCPVSL